MKHGWMIASIGLFAVLAREPALAESYSHSWSGCYAVEHTGGLRGRTDHGIDGDRYQRDVTFSGFTADAHVGCNHQSNHWVLSANRDNHSIKRKSGAS